MVFQTLCLLVRSRGPDEFWRKRKIFKLSAHFIGRRRNCYSIAIKNVHRALAYATKGRKLKKGDMAELWKTRLSAGSEQYKMTAETFQEGLVRTDILLNRKTLSELSAWEPKSFESLAKISQERVITEGFASTKNRSIIQQVFGWCNK